MQHIFISYSRHDQPYARRLAEHLIASGYDVWIDDRIDYGSRWAEVIQRAIEDCAALVVIMTPHSRESHWVQTECEYAGQKRKPIFPLLLEGDVFFRYVSVQSVNVTDGALPPQAFLDELSEHAPQRGGRGEDVAHADVPAPALAPSSSLPAEPSPAPAEPPARTTKPRRRVPLVFGVVIGVIALVVIALLLREQMQPDDFDDAATGTGVARSVQDAMDALLGAQGATPDPLAECEHEWFFGQELAIAGECPLGGWTELDGLVQQFGEATVLGMAVSENADEGRYFVLLNDGTFYDLPGAWDMSLEQVGACVLPTINGLLYELPYEDSADEVLGCPLQPVEFGSVLYQASRSGDEFVFYAEAPDDEAIYRFLAASSRPGTEGKWQRVR